MQYAKVSGNSQYKNAFQWDAYRPLVDRIPACTAGGGDEKSLVWILLFLLLSVIYLIV